MTSDQSAIPVWGLIPAAGLSRRMGVSKQTLPYGKSTMVGTLTRTLLSAGLDGVIVVTRSKLVDHLALPDDARITIEINDDSDSEMIDSIRLGIAAVVRSRIAEIQRRAANDGVLIVPGDMPALCTDTCEACCAAFREDPSRIVIAEHGGRRGHPIVLALHWQDEIKALEGGLNELPRRYADRVRLVHASDSGVVSDIDTPDQYRRDQL